MQDDLKLLAQAIDCLAVSHGKMENYKMGGPGKAGLGGRITCLVLEIQSFKVHWPSMKLCMSLPFRERLELEILTGEPSSYK